MADQAKGGLGNYPTARCLPGGMPRMMTFGEKTLILFQNTAPFGGHELRCLERMGPVLDRQNVALLNRDVVRPDRG